MEKGTVNDCNRHFEIDEIVLKIRKKHLQTVRPLNKIRELISNLAGTVKGIIPFPNTFFSIQSFFNIGFCAGRTSLHAFS